MVAEPYSPYGPPYAWRQRFIGLTIIATAPSLSPLSKWIGLSIEVFTPSTTRNFCTQNGYCCLLIVYHMWKTYATLITTGHHPIVTSRPYFICNMQLLSLDLAGLISTKADAVDGWRLRRDFTLLLPRVQEVA